MLGPSIAIGAMIACAFWETNRYASDFRMVATFLGFIPGFLAFHAVSQAILFMAAVVFYVSRGQTLSSRTNIVSALVLTSVLTWS